MLALESIDSPHLQERGTPEIQSDMHAGLETYFSSPPSRAAVHWAFPHVYILLGFQGHQEVQD
jgi:hypothetical protein